MVQTLFQISQALCIKHAARITDVGNTPYHLIKPILRRLNSKQLATLEEKSPYLMPETDEIWALLIEKEFADRPFNTNQAKLLSTGEDDAMPNKALFKQYSQEKEMFLASSAQRLRKLTANLKKEKSKNSIVPIKGIPRDPTIRRRNVASPRNSLVGSSRPKSILGKARRDISERSLMFRPPPTLAEPKHFTRPIRNLAPPSPAPKSAMPNLTEMNTSNPNGIFSHGPKRAESSQRTSNLSQSISHSNSRSAAPTQSRLPRNSASPENSASPQNSALPPNRAKRPPSMFLNSRKRTRVAPAPALPKEPIYKEKARPAPTLSKSPVKSSIFY